MAGNMTWSAFLSFLLTWSLIGCGVFTLIVGRFFRTRLVYTARNDDGILKRVVPLSGKLTMLMVPASYIVFQVSADYFSLWHSKARMNYWNLFLLNDVVYLILFWFDTLVIAGFVISIWRPSLLKIPDAMGKEAMKKHILFFHPGRTPIWANVNFG